MMHIGNHAFCGGGTAENEICSLTLLAKATLMVTLCRQNAWFQILLFEACFFKEKGAGGGR